MNESSELIRGRKFRAAELQLMLLALLEQQPQHGYELARALKDLSNGSYSPSPGVIYPALSTLVEEGVVSVSVSGRRKSYALTDSGRESLERQRAQVDRLLARLRHMARKMAWMKLHLVDESRAVEATGWMPQFVHARRDLRHALFQASDSSPDAQIKIAAILERATREINDVLATTAVTYQES